MSGRRRQGVLFLFLLLSLSAFLVGHSLVVQVEFEACFGNSVASVNGDRPFLRVAEMSCGQLAYAAGQEVSADYLIVAAVGLLPLSPFLIAWMVSQRTSSRKLWIVSAIVALMVIVGWTVTSDLTQFYDCDLDGVSLGIVITPIAYTAVTLAATLAISVPLFLRAMDPE